MSPARVAVGGVAGFAFAYGFALTGYQNPPLGVVFMVVATPFLLWLGWTWAPFQAWMAPIPPRILWPVIGVSLCLAMTGVALAMAFYSAMSMRSTTAPRQEVPKEADKADPVEPSAARIYVEKTVSELAAMVAGLTTLEGDRLTEPMVGKWIRVRGRVSDIRNGLPSTGELEVNIEVPDGSAVPYSVYCEFEKQNRNQVSHVRRNDPLRITGQIRRVIDGGGVALTNCEVVSD